jgi:hypothetical protein
LQILGQTCEVLFGDGTQQWSAFKRLKKLSTFLEEEKSKGKGAEGKVKVRPTLPTPARPPLTQFSCASCGVMRVRKGSDQCLPTSIRNQDESFESQFNSPFSL